MNTILIGVDATARSEDDAGLAAARALNAALEVVTVIPSEIYGAPALMAGPSYIIAAGDIETDIRRDLDATRAGLPSDVTATGVVLEGRPSRGARTEIAELFSAGAVTAP